MTAALDSFVAEAKAILTEDGGPAGRDKVHAKLEDLLMDDEFIAAYCGPDASGGANVLYEDPDLGFQVVSHIMDKPLEGGVHDHGESWAIYGQAVEWTDMTEWNRTDDRSRPGKATVEGDKTYRLERGMAGIFEDGAIHSISYPAGARFVRITGCDLSTIARGRYNVEEGTMKLEQRPNFDGSEQK